MHWTVIKFSTGLFVNWNPLEGRAGFRPRAGRQCFGARKYRQKNAEKR
jgi:hypothetical protein